MAGVATGLVEADGAAAASFCRTAPPEQVVTAIRSADDAALAALLEDPGWRHDVVVALLDRLEELADPDRLAALRGTVAFDLRTARGRHDADAAGRHVLVFDDARVTRVPDAGLRPDDPPDVTITTTPLHLLRIVSGEANAALLLLGGSLAVDGDALLALAVGGVFRVPGSSGAAVDPTALDPVDVGRALVGVRSDHLQAVMAGGFRPIVLSEIFRRLPDYLDQQKAAELRCTIGFRIGGRPDGGHDRWLVRVADGRCTVEPEPSAGAEESRDATISISGADFLRLATGHLHPVAGVLRGAMKVRGSRTLALAFNGALDIPAVS